MRIELANDGWAELRDPQTLTNGQRKPFMRLLAGLPTGKDGTPDMNAVDADTILSIGDTLLKAFLVEWSFGPLPAEDPAALDNLLAVDYDKLQVAAGDLMGELAPKEAAGDVPPTPTSSPQ